MTKQQIVVEISKRLGDPSATAFADRIWGYFVESFYEKLPSMTETELLNITKSDSGYITTNVEGRAYPAPANQMHWNAIVAVNIAGIHPARRIDSQEFLMMRQNAFYAPSEGEYCYYLDGKNLVLLTGSPSAQIFYTVHYTGDAHEMIGDIGNTDTLDIPNSTVYSLMAITTQKLKQEMGMLL